MAGQALAKGLPVRLFDGLRASFGTSKFELLPSNMMAAVTAAMQVAQAHQAAAVRQQQEQQEAQDADDENADGGGDDATASATHQHGAALLAGGEAGAAAAAAEEEEDEALRAAMPMQFGKLQQQRAPSLEKQHESNARGAAAFGGASLKGKAKKGIIKMGTALGASLGAGAGLAVPAATPTLVALQGALAMPSAFAPSVRRSQFPPPYAHRVACQGGRRDAA